MGSKGGKRPGAGRKVGSIGKLQANAEIAVVIHGMSPAEYLASVITDEAIDPNLRIQAARALAPYVHRKQPEAHEINGTMPVAVAIITPLTK